MARFRSQQEETGRRMPSSTLSATATSGADAKGSASAPQPREIFWNKIGHDLVGIALQSELAAALAPTSPERAAHTMQDVATVARQALSALRAVTSIDNCAMLQVDFYTAGEVLEREDPAPRGIEEDRETGEQ